MEKDRGRKSEVGGQEKETDDSLICGLDDLKIRRFGKSRRTGDKRMGG